MISQEGTNSEGAPAYVVKCDRCKVIVSEKFSKERVKAIVETAFISLCPACREQLGANRLSALKLRAKTGVVFAQIGSGDDFIESIKTT